MFQLSWSSETYQSIFDLIIYLYKRDYEIKMIPQMDIIFSRNFLTDRLNNKVFLEFDKRFKSCTLKITVYSQNEILSPKIPREHKIPMKY